ncbi:MAG: hypothetical protein HYV03_07710 [Deltaproteobacteria bacterium]|nr:hypothetical protein [Deltaproteobacteria bacterium]
MQSPGVKRFLALLATGMIGACGGGGSTDGSSGGTGESAEIPGETDIVGSVAQMEKGDIILLPFSDGQATLSFSGSVSSAEYMLIVQSAEQSAGSTSVSLGDLGAPLTGLGKALENDTESDLQTEFEGILRAAEEELAVTDEEAMQPSIGKAIDASVSVGDRSTFRVLSSLTSTTAYKEASATAKCVNSRVALYADDAIDQNLPGVMERDDYETLCNQFQTGLDTTFSVLGDPPDINGDSAIKVYMTTQVNALGASGGGIVTGFFFAGDLLRRTGSNPASNEQEIVYVLAPDPNGVYGTKLSKEFTMGNLLTAVVPHEVQHLLSYYHHVIVNGGNSEATWLNEALSHQIEDNSGFGQENPSRAALYLQTPAESPVITSGSPDLSERGASYLFLRYLYEQAGSRGDAFLKSLVQSSSTGVDNIISSYGTDTAEFNEFAEFIRRWGVAIATTDASVTTDARYTYKARGKNGTTGHWHGVCLKCDADDGRATVLTGPTTAAYTAGGSITLKAGSSAFYTFSAVPDTVILNGAKGASLQGILVRTK